MEGIIGKWKIDSPNCHHSPSVFCIVSREGRNFLKCKILVAANRPKLAQRESRNFCFLGAGHVRLIGHELSHAISVMQAGNQRERAEVKTAPLVGQSRGDNIRKCGGKKSHVLYPQSLKSCLILRISGSVKYTFPILSESQIPVQDYLLLVYIPNPCTSGYLRGITVRKSHKAACPLGAQQAAPEQACPPTYPRSWTVLPVGRALQILFPSRFPTDFESISGIEETK